MRILAIVLLLLFFGNRAVYALGECGLSCCLAGATTSDITLAKNFGLSLQYEYTNMETIRDGSHKISPNAVLDNKAAEWPKMPMEEKTFSVPTKMIMQKYTFLGEYSVTEKLQFLASVPYIINDMHMRMLTRGAMDMGHHNHAAPLAQQPYLRRLASDMASNDMRMDMEMDMEDLMVQRFLKYVVYFFGAAVFLVNGAQVSFADGEDGEAVSHNAGKDCLTSGCHASGGWKHFSLGGTIYTDAEGAAARAGAQIKAVDANGIAVNLTSDQIGNFYSAQSMTAPFIVLLCKNFFFWQVFYNPLHPLFKGDLVADFLRYDIRIVPGTHGKDAWRCHFWRLQCG